jgi:hypothetical protein
MHATIKADKPMQLKVGTRKLQLDPGSPVELEIDNRERRALEELGGVTVAIKGAAGRKAAKKAAKAGDGEETT